MDLGLGIGVMILVLAACFFVLLADDSRDRNAEAPTPEDYAVDR
ncbi:MAG: hypothetical protein ABW020_01030 [Candidatus Rokuibacteriota bacterium]